MKPTFFATPAEFRAWFEANHASEKELLVGFYKRGSGTPSISWPESVDEALCFGWIDGVRKSIDEDAYTIRFTPRKPTSIWSAINVAKVAALEKLGRMTAAGRRAFEKRTPERTGVYSFERSAAAELNADEERALRANAKAASFFDAQPPGYRRTATHWVISAKRAETRKRRFEHLLSQSARGRTIGPLTRSQAEPSASGGRKADASKATPARGEKASSGGKSLSGGKSSRSQKASRVEKPRGKRARSAPLEAQTGVASGKAPRRSKTPARPTVARQASATNVATKRAAPPSVRGEKAPVAKKARPSRVAATVRTKRKH